MLKRTIIKGMQAILTFTFLFGFAFLSITSASAERMPVKNIHFMQDSAKNTTGNYTVWDNAIALKKGTLNPQSLPAIKVWQEDTPPYRIWTLDHRRLIAFKLAGIKTIDVEWATTKEIQHNAFKYSTKDGGNSIKLKSQQGPFFVNRTQNYSGWTMQHLLELRDRFQ
ncbi:TPA: hypothetical protein QCZ04_005801 [Bacillus cereus]|uniref:hypothetical protein n=1 Tax=Bacillus cereus group sp. FL70 TaxID=3040254 RepID=UPI0032FE99FB|nr:hypothetical protein [Bacillus cereus]